MHCNEKRFILGLQGHFNIHKSVSAIYHSHRLSKKNLMVTLIGAEKTFGKIQHSFMVKSLPKN